MQKLVKPQNSDPQKAPFPKSTFRPFATLVIALAAAFGIPTEVRADEVVCSDPIDSEASVAFAPNREVVFDEDFDNRRCRFSVDGWTSGSPPQGEIFGALDTINSSFSAIRLGTQNGSENAFASSIATLLAAASPFPDGDPKLSSIPYPSVMASCLALLDEGAEFIEYQSFDFQLDGFWCAVVRPSEDGISAANDFFASSVGSNARIIDLRAPRIVMINERDGHRQTLLLSVSR
ncbi:hypothetical protein SAMN04490248_1552 [Salinihabitans flavidus]|uniref:Uncharacterized protein n=1 Tax=Salinihabitans flavidus TaxID=569882 RepID=A0A1H8WCD9_9RHOB|nr:hypothetical protein [Salinihabitans flavidus]SEP25279.1 hypothetical protein SAMN04490248_1552 [Salinihabitans flavidus]